MKSIIRVIIFIPFILFFGVIKIQAQTPTTIILEYKKDVVLRDSFYFHVMKPLQLESFGESFTYKDRLISYSEKDSLCKIVSSFDANDTSCAYLAELFGHEILLIPGDTIIVKAIQKADELTNTTPFPSRNPGRYRLSYSGRNKFMYEYSDSLALLAGDPRFDKILFKKTDDLKLFLDKVKEYYNFRVKFLDEYTARHQLPETFYYLMKTELTSAYIMNICNPLEINLATVEQYSLPYINILDSCKINNQYLYFHTSLYADFSLALINYYAMKSSAASKMNKYTLNYKLIKERASGTLRNHMLSNFMYAYSNNQPPPYDSLYNDYKLVCNNEDYKKEIDVTVKRYREKLDKIKLLTITDALSVKVMDPEKNIFSLKKVVHNGKPTIIDCWATWCGPCMRELPMEKAFEKIYVSRVNFISLSFDRNEKQWRTGPAALLSDQNYFLMNAFKSEFASFFKMNSIPRYIILDNKGNVVYEDAVRPSMKKEFKKMVDGLLMSER